MNGIVTIDRRRELAPSENEPSAEGPSDIGRFLIPATRHWRVFSVVFGITLAATLVFAFLVPKTYTTTLKLMAGNSAQNSTTATGETVPLLNALIAMSGQQSAETYADLLQEASLADRVAARLGLRVSGSELLKHIAVRPVTNTGIVSVSATWSDAEDSARIANAFGDAFVAQQRDFVRNQANNAVGYLQADLPAAERRMNAAQSAESQYESRKGIADIASQTQSLLQREAALDVKIGETRLAVRDHGASLARVNEALRSVPQTISKDRSSVPNPGRVALETQRAQLSLQLQNAREAYTVDHPVVIALARQLLAIDREIAAEPRQSVGSATTGVNPIYEQLEQQKVALSTQLRSDAAQFNELEKQRSAIGPQVAVLPQQMRTIFELRRRNKEATDLYGQLRAKLGEAKLEASSVPDSIAVVVRAASKNATITPQALVTIVSGFALALGLAFTAVYVLNLLDRTLRTERDVERELGLPVLASVPQLQIRHAYTLAERATNVESFLQLFWSLRYANDRSIKSVTLVSAISGEGKSTVALNAASALAETHPGVLLIDADLRRPTLHAALMQPRAAGLSDVLTGAHSLESVVRATAVPGLFVLTAGTPVFNSTKLLASERFADTIALATERFAMVVVDTPALNVVYDGVATCVATDAAVLVVSSSHTDVREARRAVRRLRSLKVDPIVGVVLNQTKAVRTNMDGYFSASESVSILPRVTS